MHESEASGDHLLNLTVVLQILSNYLYCNVNTECAIMQKCKAVGGGKEKTKHVHMQI